MRLFIAIQLSDAMRKTLYDIQKQFRCNGVSGNYTSPENLHLTLAFIGEYTDSDRVLEALNAVPMPSIELTLKGIGAFGDLWWIGIKRSDALNNYVKALRYALAEAGIPYDKKRFSPHITMLRRAVRGEKGMPGVVVPRTTMAVERASLMRSDRGRNGMIYTEITD